MTSLMLFLHRKRYGENRRRVYLCITTESKTLMPEQSNERPSHFVLFGRNAVVNCARGGPAATEITVINS